MPDNTSPPLTTGAIIRKLVEYRDERRSIAARDKELIDKFRVLEMEFLVRLDEQGMKKATTDDATASITEVVVPNVVDWDAIYEHIKESGDWHLLQKRPAAAAFRELHESGEVIPGIDAYTKRSISLRES